MIAILCEILGLLIVALVLAALRRQRSQPDRGLQIEADKFGRKPIRDEWRDYDESKAVQSARRAELVEQARRKQAVYRSGVNRKRTADVVDLEERKAGRP